MKTFFQGFLYLNVCCVSLFFIIWFFTSTSFLESKASAKELANASISPSVSPAVPKGSPAKKANASTSPSVSPAVPKGSPAKKANAPTSPSVSPAVPKGSPAKANASTSPSVSPAVLKGSPVKANVSTSLSVSPAVPKGSPAKKANASTSPSVSPAVPKGSPAKKANAPTSPSVSPAVPKGSPAKKNTVSDKNFSALINKREPSSATSDENIKNVVTTPKPDSNVVIPAPPEPIEDNSLSDRAEKNDVSETTPFEANSSEMNKLIELAEKHKDKKGAAANAAHDIMDMNQQLVEIYEVLTEYQYDPKDRRDPFSSPTKEEEEVSDQKIPLLTHPTGKYRLSELKLVGIRWDATVGPPKALFKAPDNVIHTLRKNDRIGSGNGIIYQFREDEVVILEPRYIAGNTSEDEDLYEPIIVQLQRVKGKGNAGQILNRGGGNNINTKIRKDIPSVGGT